MAVSPPQRPCASQQTDNEYINIIRKDFISLKNQYDQTFKFQHDYLLNYHTTILQIIQNLQEKNHEYQQNIEQLRSEINNYIQDNEALKVILIFI